MTPELQAIIERHEVRLKACGDKLMNAEKDLSVVLTYIHQVLFAVSEKIGELCEADQGSGDEYGRGLRNGGLAVLAAVQDCAKVDPASPKP